MVRETFLHHFVVLTGLCATVAVLAVLEGYFAFWQKRGNAPGNIKVEVYWRHPGMWSDFVLINPLCAYILATHGNEWTLGTALNALGVAGIGCVALLAMWANGSKQLSESLARNGQPSLAGSVHYLYMTIVLTEIALYYLGSGVRNPPEVVLVTVVLATHVYLGIVLPPKITHGRTDWMTWGMACALWAVLVALAYQLVVA